MKRIKILSTGGTISAHHEERIDVRNYTSGHYSGEEIVEALPELRDVAHITIEQLANFSSTLIDDTHWLLLRDKIQYALEFDHFDGVVITHGTNTLEETAYFLHLTLNTNKPVVLTGAQRPFSGLSSDVGVNLFNAVMVASSDLAAGKGVLTVLNNQIGCARDITKTSTYRLETFQSLNSGFLGTVDPDYSVQLYRQPTRVHTAQSAFSKMNLPEALPIVDIVYSYAGADGTMIRALIQKGVDGIVVAGTGAGRCSPEEERALYEAKEQGIVIVMSSRVGSGRVVPIDHYKEFDMVTADNLLAQKARILVKLSLLKSRSTADIQAIFNTY